jgi:ATP-dependent exoDNAse (exonuclease V) beta subunit
LVGGINGLGEALFAQRYEPLQALEPIAAAVPDADTAAQATPQPGMFWLAMPEQPGRAAAGATAVVEAQHTAAWVRQRLALGARPGDVAILLTAMAPAPLFLAALQDAGVPAAISGGSGLYSQEEIVDHIALLAWLAAPHAELQAAICLRSPLFGLSDSALWALLGPDGRASRALAAVRDGTWQADVHGPRQADGTPVLDGGDIATLAEATARLRPLVEAASRLEVHVLLRQIDAQLDARAVYLGLVGGEQRVANIQRLWGIAGAHDRAHGPALPRFVAAQLRRIRQNHKEALPAVAAAARLAVTISTVHQSKGLQYPIVILPSLTRRAPSNVGQVAYARGRGFVFCPRHRGENCASAGWIAAQNQRKEAEAEEKKRLLYVAVTRAEREVVFVGPAPEALGTQPLAALLKPWATSAPPGLTLLEPAAADVPHATVVPVAAAASAAWPTVPPDVRPVPVGTHLSVTVTQLARCATPAAAAQVVFEPTPSARPAHAAKDTAVPRPASPRGGPSRPAASTAAYLAPLDVQTSLSASLRGELAHAILAEIDERPQHASDAAFVAAMLRRRGFAPGDRRVADVRHNVERFLQSNLGQHILALPAQRRRHEMPFQLVVPQGPHRITLHGQLDLAFWDTLGPVIVDYKHAASDDTDASGFGAADEAAYLRQLDAYAWALSRLCAIPGDVRCYLVYLKDETPPLLHVATAARQAALADRLSHLTDGIMCDPRTQPHLDGALQGW